MTRLKVLLVDDNPAILATLEEILRDFAIVATLTHGRDVVARAEELKPDVIVLDISLDDVNGFEVATALKANQNRAQIVFLSIHEDAEFVRKGFECGASGYVFKSQMSKLPKAIRAVAAGRSYNPVIFGLKRPEGD